MTLVRLVANRAGNATWTAGGRERTAEQYRSLLAEVGFAVRRIIGTRSPASVIEALPV